MSREEINIRVRHLIGPLRRVLGRDSQALVLAVLWDHRNPGNGDWFPSIETLAEESGFSTRTIRRTLQKAEKQNLIWRKKDGKGKKLYHYWVADRLLEILEEIDPQSAEVIRRQEAAKSHRTDRCPPVTGHIGVPCTPDSHVSPEHRTYRCPVTREDKGEGQRRRTNKKEPSVGPINPSREKRWQEVLGEVDLAPLVRTGAHPLWIDLAVQETAGAKDVANPMGYALGVLKIQRQEGNDITRSPLGEYRTREPSEVQSILMDLRSRGLTCGNANGRIWASGADGKYWYDNTQDLTGMERKAVSLLEEHGDLFETPSQDEDDWGSLEEMIAGVERLSQERKVKKRERPCERIQRPEQITKPLREQMIALRAEMEKEQGDLETAQRVWEDAVEHNRRLMTAAAP